MQIQFFSIYLKLDFCFIHSTHRKKERFTKKKQLYKTELEVNYVILKGREKFHRFKKSYLPTQHKRRNLISIYWGVSWTAKVTICSSSSSHKINFHLMRKHHLLSPNLIFSSRFTGEKNRSIDLLNINVLVLLFIQCNQSIQIKYLLSFILYLFDIWAFDLRIITEAILQPPQYEPNIAIHTHPIAISYDNEFGIMKNIALDDPCGSLPML